MAYGTTDRSASSRVPRSVRDAVERRTAQLSAAGRHTLSLAAVAGQRFDVELLKALTGADESELLQSIKELLAAGLVIEESADRFAFRHALTREAVRAGLLARERKALHRAIAEAHRAGPWPVTDRSLEAHVADLAYHFYEAEVWDRALLYAPRAGEQAQALYAPRAAVEHFTRALEAARRLGVEPPSDLLRARGQAYETLGEFESARADFEAVLEQARAAGDQHTEWQALVDLGAAWMGRSYERGGEYYRSALELARQIGERDPRPARPHPQLRRQLAHEPRAAGPGGDHHREALTLFQRGGRSARCRRDAGSSRDGLLPGRRSHRGHRAFRAGVALLRELDHRHGLASALATLAIASGGGHFGDLMVVPTTTSVARGATPRRRSRSRATSGGVPARRTP